MTPSHLLLQRIIWAALLVATLLYLVVALVIELPPFEEPVPAFLPLPLALGAVVMLVVGLVLPPRLVRPRLLALGLPVTELAPDAALFADRPGRRRRFTDPAAARQRAIPAMNVALLLPLALAESIAIFGMLLLLLGFGAALSLPFFLVAWGFMLVRFPTARRLEHVLEAAYDADLVAPDAAG
ncbi:MAG TPA: hypothetical protein PLU22_03220 [Polyangiaceae bacterium]|nr:hypothetical protein [Polyangiaceae bacterium]